jgi:hypothetical protein
MWHFCLVHMYHVPPRGGSERCSSCQQLAAVRVPHICSSAVGLPTWGPAHDLHAHTAGRQAELHVHGLCVGVQGYSLVWQSVGGL